MRARYLALVVMVLSGSVVAELKSEDLKGKPLDAGKKGSEQGDLGGLGGLESISEADRKLLMNLLEKAKTNAKDSEKLLKELEKEM